MESPTHVGNTHGVLRRGSAPAVHPHACGEYITGDGADSAAAGSSPRVWGIRPTLLRRDYAGRFIPTRVGNTPQGRRLWTVESVHPHACGEYSTFFLRPCPLVGSSPRVWGIQALCTPAGCRTRFIPTRVGNTCPARPWSYPWPVHPHACGEYLRVPRRVAAVFGSSPRVWGIQYIRLCEEYRERFIPTRVGNTYCCRHRAGPWTVHPHACGEYQLEEPGNVEDIGSSPRVWGILSVPSLCPQRGRFIPTRVGNTSH